VNHYKRWFILGLSLLFIMALAACGGGEEPSSEAPDSSNTEEQTEGGESEEGSEQATADLNGESILLSTPSIGSTGHTLGTAAGEFFYRHLGLNVSVEPIGGGEAPLFQMVDGTVDSAILPLLPAYNAYKGEGPFEEPVNVRLFAMGENAFRVLVAPKGTDIKSLEDLKGKVFMGIRPGITEIEMIADAMLEEAGLTRDDVKLVSNTTTGETVDALRTRSVDAALFPAAAKNPNLTELFQDDAVEFIHLDEATLQNILDRLPPVFGLDSIEPGHYPNQEEEYLGIIMPHAWVVRGDLSEDIVYNMAKAIWGNFDEFSELQAAATNYSVERNTQDPPLIPFHPGVKKYFEEIGVWDESLDVE